MERLESDSQQLDQDIAHEQPDFAVRVHTDVGWVYTAEFRTWQEAVRLAETTAEGSQMTAQVRSCGRTLLEFKAECVQKHAN